MLVGNIAERKYTLIHTRTSVFQSLASLLYYFIPNVKVESCDFSRKWTVLSQVFLLLMRYSVDYMCTELQMLLDVRIEVKLLAQHASSKRYPGDVLIGCLLDVFRMSLGDLGSNITWFPKIQLVKRVSISISLFGDFSVVSFSQIHRTSNRV